MPDNMSISLNGQSQVPPGFRFHPTEEELLQYYLRKKVSYEKIDLDVIHDVDLNKLEPWDIQEKCKIGSTPQNDWYFFSHKDKKYPTGTRTNRATAAGFWKATGRDKVIHSHSKRIGMRKTLVFYKGRAPHGQKSDWIMHEYRLDDSTSDTNYNATNAMVMGESTQEEGWVVCRIFKKKNHHKTLDSPISVSSIAAETRSQRLSPSDEGTLEQIFQYMGRNCKEKNEANSDTRILRTLDNGPLHHDMRFMKLPNLESPKSTRSQSTYQPINAHMFTDINDNSAINQLGGAADPSIVYNIESGLNDWAALDRLVASQLNDQSEITSKQLTTTCLHDDPTTVAFCLPTPPADQLLQLQQLRSSSSASSASNRAEADNSTHDYNSDFDLWNFTRSSLSSTDQLCQMSNVPV
ncbi:unnamed protein product [Ilex paraguariensis]|uniref:NAC domain-containing protein n=1 Tax=Ilex paraguariensis TaxID=185542 RepID=A0ABC8SY96_9AQUA